MVKLPKSIAAMLRYIHTAFDSKAQFNNQYDYLPDKTLRRIVIALIILLVIELGFVLIIVLIANRS